MKQHNGGELFQLTPNHAGQKYDRKTVEFIYELDEELLVLTGQFVVDTTPDYERVDIRFAGRLDPVDPPCTYYVFHLSPAHLKSTHPSKRPGSKVDFLMERPLWSHECVKEAISSRE